jgi:hypothetical protein
MILNSDGSTYPRHPEQREGEVHCFNGSPGQTSAWKTVRRSSAVNKAGKHAFFVQKLEMRDAGWKSSPIGNGLTAWYNAYDVQNALLDEHELFFEFRFPMGDLVSSVSLPSRAELFGRIRPILAME